MSEIPDNIKAIKNKVFFGQPTTFQERQILKIWDKKQAKEKKDNKAITNKHTESGEGVLLIREGQTRFKR